MVAHEAALFRGGGERAAIGAEGIVLLVRAHPEVVAVDMGAGGDGLGRHADHLAVARDGRARGEVDERDLVPALHLGLRHDPEFGQRAAGGDVLERHGHRVGGVQADHAGGMFGHLVLPWLARARLTGAGPRLTC
jgi:hypothetical protein